MSNTKERILDTAERIFAEHGYSGTSLRSIIGEAGVNLAAVHYHFGSKEELLTAVVMRRAEPMNRRRLALLDQCERQAAGERLPVERVLEAFLAPTLRTALEPGGETFVQLMGRIYGEGNILPQIIRTRFKDLLERFAGALHRSLPELPPAELHWRVHFAVGSLIQALRGSAYLEAISGGLCEPAGVEEILYRLVTFLGAGFRAPVTVHAAEEKRS